MDDWQIKKPLGQCAGTSLVIEPGQDYFAALVSGPEGLERRDYSQEYWNQSKPEVYCYWKRRMPSLNRRKSFLSTTICSWRFLNGSLPRQTRRRSIFDSSLHSYLCESVCSNTIRVRYEKGRKYGNSKSPAPAATWRK